MLIFKVLPSESFKDDHRKFYNKEGKYIKQKTFWPKYVKKYFGKQNVVPPICGKYEYTEKNRFIY